MADDGRVFADLVADVQFVEQMLADPAIGDQRVDSPAHQFAEVGFVSGRRLASEQCRFAKVRAVQIAWGEVPIVEPFKSSRVRNG